MEAAGMQSFLGEVASTYNVQFAGNSVDINVVHDSHIFTHSAVATWNVVVAVPCCCAFHHNTVSALWKTCSCSSIPTVNAVHTSATHFQLVSFGERLVSSQDLLR
jgi:nickel-dependent lactate racemase